jgi:hypothetical protein
MAGWLLGWFKMPLGQRFARLVTGLGRDRPAPRMELVEVLALGGKRQLLLVVCDGRRYLVGAGGDGVQTIVAMGQSLPREGMEAGVDAVPEGRGTRAHGIRMVAVPGVADLGCGS